MCGPMHYFHPARRGDLTGMRRGGPLMSASGRINRGEPFLTRWRRHTGPDMVENSEYRRKTPSCQADHLQVLNLTEQVNELTVAVLYLLGGAEENP